MSNYFELLKQVLLKADVPYNCGTEEQWNIFQDEVGIEFPSDYKEIINYYGTGGIDNFLWFLTPFETDKNVNYSFKMSVMLDAYAESKRKFPEYFSYNIFPEENGLLPWGYTDNGDELYWKTASDTDDWEIVVYESRSPEAYHYKMGLAEFLYKLICKEIECYAFPDDLSLKKGMKYFAVKVN